MLLLDWLEQKLAMGGRSRAPGWASLVFWGCLILAAFSAVLVFAVTRHLTEEAERSRFVVAADQAAHRLAHEVDLALAHLRALKGLYEGSVHVSRDEFSAFVEALRPSAAVQSLEWIPRVPAATRREIEEAARQEGFPDFQIRQYNSEGAIVPAPDRLEYFPIYYLHPVIGNEAAFGLDLSADPMVMDVLRCARDGGDQRASGRIELTRTDDDQYGILVVDPIYVDEALDLDARTEQLEGFALGVFRVADLVRLAIPEDQFQVAVLDRSAPPGEQQIHPAMGSIDGNRVDHAVSLAVADRQWSVQLAPRSVSELSPLPWFAVATWLGVLLVLWTGRELVSSRRHGDQLALVNQRLEALSNQRKQAIRELERSNRELDDFAYIASHDLKEPLRAVHNHAAFLLEDYGNRIEADGQKRLSRLVALSRRMERLIADLLDFSRLGRGEVATEAIDLNMVIADVQAGLAESLQARNARISVLNSLPPVQAHRPHMNVLFQNLICNGVKYNESAEKIIEIGHTGEEDGPLEIFYVRDNGIGIDEQFKDDVFRIFKRLNSDKAFGEGTGAGLSFVKRIVESQGGRIWLTSERGQGTTFWFTLPGSDRPARSEGCRQAA